VEITKLLIGAGADLDMQDDNMSSALMQSVENGLSEMVDLLIASSANLDLQNHH
jgi:ankyrin repeat protein